MNKSSTTKLSLLMILILVLVAVNVWLVQRFPVSAAGEPLTISAPVTLSGAYTISAPQFIDTANSAYFIDPAATGDSLVLAGAASASGTLTLGNGQAIKSAYGPLNIQYKSGLDTWATALSVQDTTGNVGIGTTTPGQKLSVAGTVESTSGGFKFPDATTQTTAANAPKILAMQRGNVVTNTAAETTVLSTTIPGGTLSTNKAIRVTIRGKYLNNAGGAHQTDWRLKYGNTTIFSVLSWLASSTTPLSVWLEYWIIADGATNAQVAIHSGSVAADQVRYDNNTPNITLLGSATVDSTIDQTLLFTVDHDATSTSMTFTEFSTLVETLTPP